MAVEAKRGCGYRKVGGLYLVGEGAGMPCCKLPIILHICPTCNQGVKQTRGWSWIDPRPWLKGDCESTKYPAEIRSRVMLCPAAEPEKLGEKVGLLWIGEKFYPTPQDFIKEGETMGYSRRLTAVPRGFEVGKHWVFFAHPKVKSRTVTDERGYGAHPEWDAGVFRIFKPTRIEKLITDTMSKDAELMEGLAKKGITPVIVPDNDPDHQGSVYDKEDDEPKLPMLAHGAPYSNDEYAPY